MEKNHIELINNNFTAGDIMITVSSKTTSRSATIEESIAEVRNYVRRLQKHIEKSNLEELKYFGIAHNARRSGQVHNHIVINFKDMAALSRLWPKALMHMVILRAEDFGYLASYINVDCVGQEAYVYSRNLTVKKGGC